MWGITYMPLVDVLIDMAWACVHKNLVTHLNGLQLYPASNFDECRKLMASLVQMLCGKDYDPAAVSMGFKFMDLSLEEPVPRTFIINHDCMHHGPGITFNANGHTAVQSVSCVFQFRTLVFKKGSISFFFELKWCVCIKFSMH